MPVYRRNIKSKFVKTPTESTTSPTNTHKMTQGEQKDYLYRKFYEETGLCPHRSQNKKTFKIWLQVTEKRIKANLGHPIKSQEKWTDFYKGWPQAIINP